MSNRDSGFPPASDLVEQALADSGADRCTVLVEERWSANVRFAVNAPTSNGLRRSRSVTVVSFVDGPEGTSSASVTRSGVVDVGDLVAESESLARSAQPAPDAHEPVHGVVDADFSQQPDETGHEALTGIVTGLAGAFPVAERLGTTLAGYAQHAVETTYLGTSTGLRRRHAQPTGEFQLNGRADAGRRSAWSSAATPHLDTLHVDGHVAEIHQRLQWASTPIELPAGRYEAILPPIAVADLMIYLYWTLSARNAADGRTVFSRRGGGTRVGDQLSALPFELRGDPEEPDLACMPFLTASASSEVASVFDNGAPLSRTAWIKDGVLENLFTPRADARRDGTRFAAPIDNLVLELPGAIGATEDLVARTERGLLLTCLWYIREVDPAMLLLTGLTRDGVYLVEDGQIKGAVNNFRFNESPVDLLGRAVESGATTRTMSREWGDEFNRTCMPPLRIPDFNMSSVSPAN
jgi:predicted Zn-dependent protease